jgi:hypothetical protein
MYTYVCQQMYSDGLYIYAGTAFFEVESVKRKKMSKFKMLKSKRGIFNFPKLLASGHKSNRITIFSAFFVSTC